MGDRTLAAAGEHRHALAITWMTPHRLVDRGTADDHTVHHRTIFAMHLARLYRGHQVRLRRQGLGNHHQTAGIAIQAMHNSRTRHFGHLRTVGEEPVQQRIVHMTGRGMNHQPDRFVDHEYRLILENDTQRHRRGLPFPLGLRFGVQRQLIARGQRQPGLAGLAIDGQAPLPDPALQSHPRKIGEQRGRGLVQALTARGGRHDGTARDRLLHRKPGILLGLASLAPHLLGRRTAGVVK